MNKIYFLRQLTLTAWLPEYTTIGIVDSHTGEPNRTLHVYTDCINFPMKYLTRIEISILEKKSFAEKISHRSLTAGNVFFEGHCPTGEWNK